MLSGGRDKCEITVVNAKQNLETKRAITGDLALHCLWQPLATCSYEHYVASPNHHVL